MLKNIIHLGEQILNRLDEFVYICLSKSRITYKAQFVYVHFTIKNLN